MRAYVRKYTHAYLPNLHAYIHSYVRTFIHPVITVTTDSFATTVVVVFQGVSLVTNQDPVMVTTSTRVGLQLSIDNKQ